MLFCIQMQLNAYNKKRDTLDMSVLSVISIEHMRKHRFKS